MIDIKATISADGKLPQLASDMIRREIRNNSGKAVQIIIKQASAASVPQFQYLYGVVYPIIKLEFEKMNGEKYSIQDVDHSFKLKFWYDEKIDPISETSRREPKAKATMNKKELTEYIENVIRWAEGRLRVTIPSPPDKGEVDAGYWTAINGADSL